MPDYFTLVELRALPDVPLADFPDAVVESAAAYIVGVIEREVGTSFIARTATAEPHDGGVSSIALDRGHARAVSAVTVDGVAYTGAVLRDGVLHASSTGTTKFSAGRGNVLVTYTYGYSTTPPSDVKEVALKGTRAHLLANSEHSMMNDRRTSLSTEMGTISFVVAGEGRPTGYPEVDATILGWKQRLDVLGFA